jgi:hypothetical protein
VSTGACGDQRVTACSSLLNGPPGGYSGHDDRRTRLRAPARPDSRRAPTSTLPPPSRNVRCVTFRKTPEQDHPAQRHGPGWQAQRLHGHGYTLDLRAAALFALGREAEARRIYNQLADQDSIAAWGARGRLGVIAAHAGDRAMARQIYDGLLADTFVVSFEAGALFVARAAVATALGDREAVTRHLSRMFPSAAWQNLHGFPTSQHCADIHQPRRCCGRRAEAPARAADRAPHSSPTRRG